MAKRTCPKGRVKSGPRKGLCKKKRTARKSASSCPFGKVKRGPRKGQCLKNKRARKR